MIILGHGPTINNIALNDLHVFDLVTLTWVRVINSGEIPCARWNHSLANIGSRIVIFGGL